MPEDRERPDALERKPHVLIAGAGIGGLSAALFAARAGWRVTLVDREPALQEAGAGLQISPNAARLLAGIGVLDALDDIAVEPNGILVHRASDDRILAHARFGHRMLAKFGAPFLVAHRADLQRALLDKVEAHVAITLKLGLALREIHERPEVIEADFESADGTGIRLGADLLVGADGLWSRARKLCGLPSASRYSGKTAWRTLIPREEAPLFAREPDVHLWLGANAHLVHYPVRGGHEINVVAIIEDDWREEGWSAPGHPDVLASRFEGWHARARSLIAAAESWKRWALVDRAPETRWSRARMTLLGDAAHPMMPFLAQGASQAIEDAACLGSLIAGAGADPAALAAALARYDRLRIPRTARIQNAARSQGRLYHATGLQARLRDTALSLLPGDAPLERFGWIYRHDARIPGA
ncbi:MAG: FAD-dependent monooxygenase [Beijerinckiaceae bacterium]|nr:FAD-dependent monooxygenase [Beijerinckiaceae bacterium]